MSNICTSEVEVHTVEIPFHKRFMQSVRPPKNWGAWLELAAKAQTLDEKLGLLHGAFNVEMGRRAYDPEIGDYPLYLPSERLEAFFQIADGWTDSNNFDWRAREERWSRQGHRNDEKTFFVGYGKGNGRDNAFRTESQQRQVLARKAFDMLCANFFNARVPDPHRYSSENTEMEIAWMKERMSGSFLPVIQRFYRVEEGGLPGDVVMPPPD